MRESARLPLRVVRMRPSDVEHGLEDRHDASIASLACALERRRRKHAAGEMTMRPPLESDFETGEARRTMRAIGVHC